KRSARPGALGRLRFSDRDDVPMLEARHADPRDPDRVRGPSRRSLQDEPEDHLGSALDGLAAAFRRIRRVRFTRGRVVAAALSLMVATRAHAIDNGAWRTFLRPVECTDVLATGSEVWGATAEGGLLRWVPGADTFAVIRRQPGSIPANRLTRVARDGAGRLWVGSRSAGASHLDPGATHWNVVTAIDGLPSDSVTVLEPQGDSLWIGTTKGVALWNGREIAGSLPDEF